ncbi:HAMP domain-containing protein [Roseateles sp. DAIF2]|uniref:methyl-accepting chemotaxis protein n=1 Tax=Roseateles sp. DAIF2 TaxID=2714952 RepID=UPI0018A32768|nr:methyl-accepting chemotaxis protein [Roseateles sp. DAIF2]QPF73087.1 HAMP domain-containing protein [Roseateles sp. DAIF2]
MNMSALLRRFSIRTRMIGAIAMVLTLLLAVGSVGLLGMNSMRDQTKQFAEGSVVEANQVTRLVHAMGEMRRFEKDMIINYEKPEVVKEVHAKWDGTRKTIADIAKKMRGGESEGDKNLMTKALALLDGYAAKAQPVLAQLEAGGYDNAAVADKLLTRAKDDVAGAEKLIEELRAALEAEGGAAQQRAEATQGRVLSAFIVVLVLAAAVVVPLTLLNMHSICAPLADAEVLAEAIAKGDLTLPAKVVEGQDEASHLMRSLQNMQSSLQSLVGQLRTSADSIRTASVEIATGNQDLSSRTEQTAGNLQQTASSMVQLTGTVKQTADSARTANQLASSAFSAAAKGGEVVSQVVSTMDEINTSSKKISDIIGTIDGIAFQTNILALNAAVEAARAGEQGRGFAVVAGEVRSLAQRSAEAAREIKTLIGASVERVETGARLVQEAGTSMTDIVASVQRVTDIIGEITAAASEQSDGIGQVNQSVTQLDQMTQQNAALVEESAAAAESLKDQAERLALAVDKFRISSHRGDTLPAVAAAPAPRPAALAASASAAAAKKSTTAAPRPVASKSAGLTTKPAAKPVSPPALAKPSPVLASTANDGDWETF